MLSLLRSRTSKIEALDLVTRERPPLPSDRTGLQETPRAAPDLLAEYAELTKSLGVTNPHIDADLKVERFKAFLRQKDWPIFSLPTVKAYMDKKSAEESAAKAGWHWRPLRAKDDIEDAHFGTAAKKWDADEDVDDSIRPASDFYRGPHLERRFQWSGSSDRNGEKIEKVGASSLPYDKLVPIHALRKVAIIEREFAEPVSFFVCDYAPAPHIEHPDPFLMAVVNNDRLSKGVGRFVIDFWDEPGFGIEQQLG